MQIDTICSMDKGIKKLMIRLKEYRLKHQLTQEDLAKKLRVTRLTLSRWFNNKNTPRELEQYRIEELLRKK